VGPCSYDTRGVLGSQHGKIIGDEARGGSALLATGLYWRAFCAQHLGLREAERADAERSIDPAQRLGEPGIEAFTAASRANAASSRRSRPGHSHLRAGRDDRQEPG
jgi:hypothetical protein